MTFNNLNISDPISLIIRKKFLDYNKNLIVNIFQVDLHAWRIYNSDFLFLQ